MTPKWDVLGFGAVTVDDLLYVNKYPLPDTKTRLIARQREGGGLAGTALVAASRMGVKAAYCGVLGNDDLSTFTIQELEREGVDCTAVMRRKEARPIQATVIVVPSSQQRTILYASTGAIGPLPEQVTDSLIANCRILFLDHTVVEMGLHAVKLAHAHDIPVVADFESDDDPRLVDLMHQVDHLIVGIHFAQKVTGADVPEDMVRALSTTSRACCVVTAGEKGCWFSEQGGEVSHFPAYQVQVIDTTGCGDVFHGAYAACIARGESSRDAIQVASAAAALKTTQTGGRRGIPNRAIVDQFISAYHSG
jgi:sugar/nucleoside kinase (ribokinase family)